MRARRYLLVSTCAPDGLHRPPAAALVPTARAGDVKRLELGPFGRDDRPPRGARASKSTRRWSSASTPLEGDRLLADGIRREPGHGRVPRRCANILSRAFDAARRSPEDPRRGGGAGRGCSSGSWRPSPRAAAAARGPARAARLQPAGRRRQRRIRLPAPRCCAGRLRHSAASAASYHYRLRRGADRAPTGGRPGASPERSPAAGPPPQRAARPGRLRSSRDDATARRRVSEAQRHWGRALRLSGQHAEHPAARRRTTTCVLSRQPPRRPTWPATTRAPHSPAPAIARARQSAGPLGASAYLGTSDTDERCSIQQR